MQRSLQEQLKRDLHLDRYLKYLKHRAYMLDIWKKSHYQDEVMKKIQETDRLEIVDMREVASATDMEKFVEYDFNTQQV